jgi:uncharacterized cupredoxin-like copper-binding protein
MKFIAVATLSVIAALAATSPSHAEIVRIKLWDKGADAPMATDMGMGMPADHKMSGMGLKLSTETVKAGKVTFEVANASKETVHEMVLFPIKDGERVPYSDKESKIIEDAAGHLGEVAELDPGKGGKLEIDLKPGKYLLTCNIPGHYMNGMWTVLTVK